MVRILKKKNHRRLSAKPTVIPTVAPTITPSLSTEYIFFGQYEQDNNTSNGKENIEWLVLDKQDKIFLFSIDEANEYFDSDEERMCGTTDYAKAQGVTTSDTYNANDKATCRWWLRSPGMYQNMAADVIVHGLVDDYGGIIGEYGVYVDDIFDAVRPALWINLES